MLASIFVLVFFIFCKNFQKTVPYYPHMYLHTSTVQKPYLYSRAAKFQEWSVLENTKSVQEEIKITTFWHIWEGDNVPGPYLTSGDGGNVFIYMQQQLINYSTSGVGEAAEARAPDYHVKYWTVPNPASYNQANA